MLSALLSSSSTTTHRKGLHAVFPGHSIFQQINESSCARSPFRSAAADPESLGQRRRLVSRASERMKVWPWPDSRCQSHISKISTMVWWYFRAAALLTPAPRAKQRSCSSTQSSTPHFPIFWLHLLQQRRGEDTSASLQTMAASPWQLLAQSKPHC